MSKPPLDPGALHKLILAAFEGRDNAYAPYSNFRVGAALLADDGSIINGCNVENASYGGTICAERTAITKAVSLGHRLFRAVVVTSDVPSPTISPCGICRQVLREFLPLQVPVYMVSARYPREDEKPPDWLASLLQEGPASEKARHVVVMMTMEELLPMSFGPEDLEKRQVGLPR